MFSRIDFFDIAEGINNRLHRLGCYPGLHFHRYPQFAFDPPDGEEGIRITRAPKCPGDSGLNFWLCAEWMADWRGREAYFVGYLSGASFEAINEREFNDLVAARCTHLIAKLALPLNTSGTFMGAILLYSMKTKLIVSLVAEYEDEYIHFYWDTTH